MVHACLEGPESGVYYRGEGEISNNQKSTIIYLPNYVKYLAKDFTIQITPILDFNTQDEDFSAQPSSFYASQVIDNSFKVFGKPSKFYWHVTGKRREIEVEPDKKDFILKGDGPYTYIVKK